ncbi:MAG TPA: hypothetical protein DCK83_00905 [Gallionellaceae bacterium]|nr:hypothetical protein [Gallionellaceae bacterium]
MYLPLTSVKQRCTLSTSTIYRLIKKNLFPAPVRLSPGRVAWRESDVEKWEQNPSHATLAQEVNNDR